MTSPILDSGRTGAEAAAGVQAAIGAPEAAARSGGTAGAPEAVESRLPLMPGRLWILLAALYVASAALAVRLLLNVAGGEDPRLYAGLLSAFFVMFTAAWMRPRMPVVLLHLILGAQCLVVLALLLIEPELDYAASFFVPLAYQAAVLFSGRIRWSWVSGLLVLIVASLTITLGLRGLGLAMTPMAVAVALSAMVAAGREIETARVESQRMVLELEATHGQLERYAAEVEDLAAIEERNRLLRELHDSVSQAMFAILLATRSAQMLLEKEPKGVRGQLEQLRDLTQDALARMRGFIAELRQPGE